MAVNPENLIEQFASLLEIGEQLDSQDFANRAIDLIVMLSMEPSLNDTLIQINARLQSIIRNANKVKFDAMATGTQVNICAANQIRELKNLAYPSASKSMH